LQESEGNENLEKKQSIEGGHFADPRPSGEKKKKKIREHIDKGKELILLESKKINPVRKRTIRAIERGKEPGGSSMKA